MPNCGLGVRKDFLTGLRLERRAEEALVEGGLGKGGVTVLDEGAGSAESL